MVVAEVPVALTKVKFWRVVEPERMRFERFARVAVRLVPVMVEAKRDVVVALVEVELRAVKFWRVDEPLARMLPKVPKAVVVMVLVVSIVPKPEAMEPDDRAPTLVRDELTTPAPNVSLDSTLALLMRYEPPVARLMLPDDRAIPPANVDEAVPVTSNDETEAFRPAIVVA